MRLCHPRIFRKPCVLLVLLVLLVPVAQAQVGTYPQQRLSGHEGVLVSVNASGQLAATLATPTLVAQATSGVATLPRVRLSGSEGNLVSVNASGQIAVSLADGLAALLAAPTVAVGLTTDPGVATTALRSDARLALDVTIAPTWTGLHAWRMASGGTTALRIESETSGQGHVLGIRSTVSAAQLRGEGSTGTLASPAIIGTSSTVLQVVGYGHDGASYQNLAAVRFQTDGANGAGDMPGRLVFLTTPDGSVTLAEVFRMSNAGNVGTVTAWGTSAAGVFALKLGTPGTTFLADQAELSAGDWNGAGTAAFRMQGEEGATATHTFGSTVKLGGALQIVGTMKSTAANDLGWVVQNAANQACNTTCTTGACVAGFDTAALGNLLACTDATADSCLCAG